MTRATYLLSIAAPLVFAATGTRADVTISSDPTSNMACSVGVCAPTAASAVLNVNDLETLLASGNVEVTTTGSGVQANNIDVDAALSWSSTNSLAFDAYNSIVVAEPVSVTGLSALSIATRDGGGSGTLSFGNSGNVTFADLSSALVINGQSFHLESSISTLASAISADPRGNYALANSYDAKGDGTYKQAPIQIKFRGTFEGLGNAISNLSVNDPSNGKDVGLFAEVGKHGTISDVVLSQANITGDWWVGGIAGENNGRMFHVSVAGVVTASNGATAGGLVGGNWGAIKSSSATAALNGTGSTGGLVGANTGEITNSYASGTVSAGNGALVGGLAGWSETQSNTAAATIYDCYASGTVTDSAEGAYTGGLVGLNSGEIRRSYATGSVVGGVDAATGGLVGAVLPDLDFPENGITDSYETGTVTSGDQGYAGGLAGGNGGAPIDRTYAAGAVSGGASTIVGGLVGVLSISDSIDGILAGAIKNSYALGNVIGGQGAYVGGLVGENYLYRGYAGTMASSYSIGDVSGDTGAVVGGSVGKNQAPKGNIDHVYWDTTTSGTDVGVGHGNRRGVKGLATTQLQSGLPPGFRPTIWTENSTVNNGLPYLIAIPPN